MKNETEVSVFLQRKNYFLPNKPIIDQIIDSKGYYSFQFVKLTICYMINCFYFGLETTPYGPLETHLQKHFNMQKNEFEIALLSIYLGAGAGSLMSKFVMDNIGRKAALSLFFALSLVCNLLSLLCTNYIQFSLLRFIIGFQLGVTIPIGLSNYSEMIPSKYRGLCGTYCMIMASSAGFLNCLAVKLFSPTLKGEDLITILSITLCIKIAAFAVFLTFSSSSVRYLVINDREKEAINIIAEQYNERLDSEASTRLVNEIKQLNLETTSSFSDLFNTDFKVSTCLLIVLWFAAASSFSIPVVSFSTTIERLELASDVKSEQSAIVRNMLIFFSGATACLFGGIMCEIKELGRKKTIVFCSFTACCLSVLSMLVSKWFQYVFPVAFLFNNISFILLYTYTAEIFKTSLRVKALGLLIFMARMGGVFGNFIAVELFSFGVFGSYYLFTFLCALYFICSLALPFETNNVALDQTHLQETLREYNTLEQE